jgi:amino acid adenylation domain-containing protein
MRLHELLASAARHDADAVAAMETGGGAITYGKLDNYSTQISAALITVGVGPGDRVGLCLTKTIGALAAVFGVLKADAAYVPVDVSAPSSRNAYIFNDCAVKAIIVEAAVADKLLADLSGVEWVRSQFPAPAAHPADYVVLSRPAASTPERFGPVPDLAYILYTSGSTGRPKGVMHSHNTAMAFIDWCSAEFSPVASDRFSSHAPFHFDLSILDIYVPIKHGASVVLIGSEAGKQPGLLAALIAEQRITVWYSTPSILRMLLEYGQLEQRDYSSLRILNFAGEVFPLKHLRALMAAWPHPTYYNLYGPTETNVCTFYKLPRELPAEADYALPIGVKCSGDETRIVEPDGQEVAPGGEGELVVAGGSVMLGYWNLPERSSEAFLGDDSARWYRTGDVVKENQAGELIFLGRRDRMVKRRGFRVELGEIEAALHRHSAIPEAAVIAKTGQEGEIEIHAFHTWTDSSTPSLIKLKQFCSQHLPLYMTPDRFKALDELPKTSTDKIDYQRLKDLI